MPDLAYLATAPCGCAHGIDTGDNQETYAQVAEWLRRGSTVRRIPLSEAMALLVQDCSHNPRWGRND